MLRAAISRSLTGLTHGSCPSAAIARPGQEAASAARPAHGAPLRHARDRGPPGWIAAGCSFLDVSGDSRKRMLRHMRAAGKKALQRGMVQRGTLGLEDVPGGLLLRWVVVPDEGANVLRPTLRSTSPSASTSTAPSGCSDSKSPRRRPDPTTRFSSPRSRFGTAPDVPKRAESERASSAHEQLPAAVMAARRRWSGLGTVMTAGRKRESAAHPTWRLLALGAAMERARTLICGGVGCEGSGGNLTSPDPAHPTPASA